MKKPAVVFALLPILSPLLIGAEAAAQSYDVVGNFNGTGTQPLAGDPFTYGTEATLGGAFSLFPYFSPSANCTFYGGTCASGGTLVDYYYNANGNFTGPTVALYSGSGSLSFGGGSLVVPNNAVVMAPGSAQSNSPAYSVTQFTAPTAGVYNISGTFNALQGGDMSYYAIVNGVQTSLTAGRAFSFSDIALAKGSNIDFIVESIGGSQGYDTADLMATISSVPEPSTYALMIAGIAALGCSVTGRRQRRA